MGALLRCGLLLTLFILLSSANPGVKLRVTQSGLNHVSEIAQQFLAHQLRNLRLDDQDGRQGYITWNLRNIRNRGVVVPSSWLSFDPYYNAISWSLSGLSIDLYTDYYLKYKRGWFVVTNNGRLDARVTDISLQVSIRLGRGSDGRPSLSYASCSASISSIRLQFSGGFIGWVLNLFRRPIQERVRAILPGQICNIVRQGVNNDGNEAMSQLKVNVALDPNLVLDYSLSSAPVVTSSYLDILDKGEVYWRTNRQTPPYTPRSIPAMSDSSRMLYMWMTEYPVQSALFAAHSNDQLRLVVDQNNLPSPVREALNTTCSLLCLGNLIPLIGQQFPNRQVKLEGSTSSVPDFVITPRGMTMTLRSNIDMTAEASGQQPAHLMTLNMTLTVSVQGQIVDERIRGEITSHSFEFGVVSSEVGPIDPTILTSILGNITSQVVVPQLNELAQSGADLPVTGEVTFRNTRLELLEGSLLIGADVTYNYVLRRKRRETDDTELGEHEYFDETLYDFDEEDEKQYDFIEKDERQGDFDEKDERLLDFDEEDEKLYDFIEKYERLGDFDEEDEKLYDFIEKDEILRDFDEKDERLSDFDEKDERLSDFDEKVERLSDFLEKVEQLDGFKEEAEHVDELFEK